MLVRLLVPCVATLVLAATNAAPADAPVPNRKCEPAGATLTVTASLALEDLDPTSITIRVDYPPSVGLPGQGRDPSVRERIRDTPSGSVVSVFDQETALKVVLARAAKYQAGPVFTVEFDQCEGDPLPTAGEFRCTVEGAARATGPISGATCKFDLAGGLPAAPAAPKPR